MYLSVRQQCFMLSFALIFWQVKISYSKYCTSTVLHRHPQLCSKNYTHLYKISKICFKQNLLTKIINETVCKPYAKAGNYLIYQKNSQILFWSYRQLKKCVFFLHTLPVLLGLITYLQHISEPIYSSSSNPEVTLRMELSGFKFKFNLIL